MAKGVQKYYVFNNKLEGEKYKMEDIQEIAIPEDKPRRTRKKKSDKDEMANMQKAMHTLFTVLEPLTPGQRERVIKATNCLLHLIP